jgi:addiction module RelB/DinJ family antitoxin
MNTAIVNIKTDPETKKQLQAFAAQVGLPVSALLNAQIKQILRTGQLEFSTQLEPNAHLVKVMQQAEENLVKDQNITHTNNTKEALDHLDAL